MAHKVLICIYLMGYLSLSIHEFTYIHNGNVFGVSFRVLFLLRDRGATQRDATQSSSVVWLFVEV
jgi:hypothetical protein